MSLPLPDERNFEIFYEHEYGGKSLRALAAEHELTPGRIEQIVAQVRRWYCESTPDWAAQCEAPARMLVAHRVHEERLRHQYSEAMEAWRSSKGPQKTVRGTSSAASINTHVTRESHGDPRYLLLAAKISERMIDSASAFARAVAGLKAQLDVTPPEDPAPAVEETPPAEVADAPRVYAPEEPAPVEPAPETIAMVAATPERDESYSMTPAAGAPPAQVKPRSMRRREARAERRREELRRKLAAAHLQAG